MDHRKLFGQPPDQGPRRKVWHLGRDGWSRADSPIDDAAHDFDDAVAAEGFRRLTQLGHECSSLHVHVFHRQADDLCLVSVDGPGSYVTFLADLPGILALLPGLAAAVRDAATLDREAEA